jgi:uncharacterized membrane protein HdeD (DUF308 family)
MTTFVGSPDDDAIRSASKWFLAFGVVLVVLGLIALLNVVDATLVTTVLVGLALIVGGIAQIVGAFMQSGTTGRRVLQAVIGVLYIIVGGNLVADPLAGAVALTIVIGIWLLIAGVMRLAAALMQRPPHTLLLVVTGIINLVLGVWIITGIPYSGIAIGLFVGIELLMAGFLWIALWFAARSAANATSVSPA